MEIFDKNIHRDEFILDNDRWIDDLEQAYELHRFEDEIQNDIA